MAVGTIWHLFERAVERFGGSPAVVDGDTRLTYEALAGRVRGLAKRLGELGLSRGERVAVLDRNSCAYLAAYFAAAGRGAVLVPLNHRLAARELRTILADAGARCLIAGRAFEELVARLSQPPGPAGASAVPDAVVWTDEVPDADAPFAAEPAAADELAQLYYTSGTTGRPKGVMLTHANVCTHAEVAVRELGLGATDRWGHFAPMFHLADAWACFAITLAGGLHVIVPRFEPRSALATMRAEGVTVTNLVPTMIGDLLRLPDVRADAPDSLRLLLSGGAPIARATVRALMEVFRCEYAQTYGMTETSPYLTLSLLHERLRALPPEERLRYRARTGRPFAAVELEVVDELGRPVPPDDRTVGEIRVKGPTVSPGYWRRPEETAAAFRDGWLYTGDLAVIDAEGYVDIVDRRKDVIVTGGENVYSTEVENVLYEHPAVAEAAVFGIPDERWGEAVAAAVVLAPHAELEAEELIEFCRERIAGYKLPRTVAFRDELPRTGSGKIAKSVLREEARGRSLRTSAHSRAPDPGPG